MQPPTTDSTLITRIAPDLDRLQALLDDVSQLHSKLIVVTGGTGEERAALLQALQASQHAVPLHLGVSLAAELIEIPQRERPLRTASVLREMSQKHEPNSPLLLDGIELLFDASLRANALDLLKRQSLVRPVVAIWPGECRNGRLTYATLGHPEHQDHAVDGVIIFEL